MALKTFHRGVADLKFATWNSEGSYGTAYDVLGVRNFSMTLEIESDQVEGDDAVLDRFSKVIAANFTFEQAAVDLEVVQMMTGNTLVSNASYEDLTFEENSMPYLAVAVKVESSSGGKDLHIFLPKCKVSGNLNLQAGYGQYMLPSADFQAVKEGDTNGIGHARKFAASTALEIPLRTTTGSS